MGVATHYCNQCGERIDQKDFDSGGAVQYEDACYCEACKKDNLEDQTAYLVQEAPSPGAAKKKGRSRLSPSPGSRRVKAVGGGNSRGRRPRSSSGLHRVRAKGGPRQAKRDTSGQLILAVGGALAILLICILALVFGSRGHEPEKEPASGSFSREDDRERSDPERPDPEAELGRSYLATLALDKSKMDRHLEVIRAWQGLVVDAVGTSYEQKAHAGLSAARRRRDAESGRVFQRLRRVADYHVSEGDFRAARTTWKGFSPQLSSPEWNKRIAQELRRIEQAEEALAAARRSRLVRGTIPSGGRTVDVFDDKSFDRWERKGGEWSIKDGELTLHNPDASGSVYGYTFYWDSQGSKRMFGDFYLTFEFQIVSRTMSLLARIPRKNLREGQRLQFDVSADGESIIARTWYRAHLVLRRRKAEFWVDDALSLKRIDDCSSIQGAIGLKASAGCSFKLRKMTVRLLREGGLFRPPPPESSGSGTPVDLFDGKSLASWQGENISRWPVEKGVISAVGGEGGSYVYRGDRPVTDFRLSFDIRGLEGRLTICLRWVGSKYSYFELDSKNIPDLTRWYKVVIDVHGDLAHLSIPELKFAETIYTVTDTGAVGFTLNKDSACSLRRISLEKYR